MSLTPKEIAHLANLAKLKTSNEQAKFYATQLSQIMELIEQMNTIDTSGVQPMSHPQDAALRLRADEATATNDREAYQAVAPATENGLYLVPKVID